MKTTLDIKLNRIKVERIVWQKNSSSITTEIQIDVKESVIRSTKRRTASETCWEVLSIQLNLFCQGDWSDITSLQNAVKREILGKSYGQE
jgi:hypothetical protein